MTLGADPIAGESIPETSTAVEEYKLQVEETRFLMTRYMQAGAIYLALIGFAAKLTMDTSSLQIALLVAVIAFFLNLGTFYVAGHFRSMVYHALNRVALLADHLGTQQPHPMMWGYYIGLITFAVIQVALGILVVFCALRVWGGTDLTRVANPGSGQPLRFISSCQIDLNADGEADVSMLVETVRGWEPIVLMKKSAGYDTYVVAENKTGMYLTCRYGSTVTEFPSDDKSKLPGKTYKTPGAYLELAQPEGSAVAYYWNGSGFTEVWTSD
jgi:hypothetical protein